MKSSIRFALVHLGVLLAFFGSLSPSLAQELDTERIIVVLDDGTQPFSNQTFANVAELQSAIMEEPQGVAVAVLQAFSEVAAEGLIDQETDYRNNIKPTAGIAIVEVSDPEKYNEALQSLQKKLKAGTVLQSFYRDANPGFDDINNGASVVAASGDSSVARGVAEINAPRVWAELKLRSGQRIDGTGVTVAVIDTGIFRTAINSNGFSGASIRFESQFNLVAQGVPEDEAITNIDGEGHGTHVAGTIVGQSGFGVAPGATLIPIKVFTKRQTPRGIRIQASDAQIFDAVDLAVRNGAQVVNMSLGFDFDANLKTQWDRQLSRAKDANVLIVAASGNGLGGTSLPAAADEAIAVAATVTGLNSPASFSRPTQGISIGRNADIAAPGTDIISFRENGNPRTLQGTSMATPHVAGLCALLRQVDKNLTRADILANFATTTASGTRNDSRRLGRGRIDAFASVQVALGNTSKPDPPGQGIGGCEKEKGTTSKEHAEMIARLDRATNDLAVVSAFWKKQVTASPAKPGKKVEAHSPGDKKEIVDVPESDKVKSPDLAKEQAESNTKLAVAEIKTKLLRDELEKAQKAWRIAASDHTKHEEELGKAKADVSSKKMSLEVAAVKLPEGKDTSSDFVAATKALQVATKALHDLEKDTTKKDAAAKAEESHKKAVNAFTEAETERIQAQTKVEMLKKP